MTGQIHDQIMIQQFEDLIYPTLQNRYHFRKAHNKDCWYVSAHYSEVVYALIYDGEPPRWRVNNVTGFESDRREIETEVRALCNPNQ